MPISPSSQPAHHFTQVLLEGAQRGQCLQQRIYEASVPHVDYPRWLTRGIRALCIRIVLII